MIEWIVVAGVLVASAIAVSIFLDEVLEWATQAIERILDGINRAVTVVSSAMVYLVKKGHGYYRQVTVYTRRNGNTKSITKEERVNKEDLPDEIKEELDEKEKKLVAKQKV